jgi:hypothetical protein
VGSWGEQVLGKIASKMMVMIMLFFQSLARGRVDFDATGEHTSGVEARPARNGDSQVWSRLLKRYLLSHARAVFAPQVTIDLHCQRAAV